MTGRVTGLWVYPVKSMRGQALRAADVDTRGLVGDRLYAVRDEAGKFGSGKNTRRFARMDGLERWSARRSGENIEIAPPAGEWLDGASDRAAALLTAQVGRPVTLVREADISHFDAAAVHVVTTGDLARLGALCGLQAPPESFRSNILLETDEASAEWIGRTIQIGSAALEIIAPTERCLMVNVAPDGAPGPDFLRTLAQRMDACFGVYAGVARAGRVATGDVVNLVN
ncbi:MAG: MOSC domain-containing protein [Rhodoblastus sp.]